jgi:hypothetical protein
MNVPDDFRERRSSNLPNDPDAVTANKTRKTVGAIDVASENKRDADFDERFCSAKRRRDCR